jgi:hypothetical protein
MSNPTATWNVSIDTHCPKCEFYFNICDGIDFWDGRDYRLCEHGTERTRDIEVECPECSHKFNVDLDH